MDKEKWLFEIKPKGNLFELNLKEIWQFRDLLLMLVKRNIITMYKQTILGPLWYVIQPLFTSVIFTLVFNNIANISTGQVPAFLFNLAGVTAWGYFSDCLISTSDTFKSNASLFSKVYFPRVLIPLSIVISNLLKFGIQFVIFTFFLIYFKNKGSLSSGWEIFYLPILVLSMGFLALGLGMIVSSMVTKYRDLNFVVSFGVQLLMYLSAVMYPVTVVKEKIPRVAWLIEYNPMTNIIETFRNIVLGINSVPIWGICRISIISVGILALGLLIFNKTEKSFIDIV